MRFREVGEVVIRLGETCVCEQSVLGIAERKISLLHHAEVVPDVAGKVVETCAVKDHDELLPGVFAPVGLFHAAAEHCDSCDKQYGRFYAHNLQIYAFLFKFALT